MVRPSKYGVQGMVPEDELTKNASNALRCAMTHDNDVLDSAPHSSRRRSHPVRAVATSGTEAKHGCHATTWRSSDRAPSKTGVLRLRSAG